jgi:LAS superfamily LD-carboxypeptidase LdcB
MLNELELTGRARTHVLQRDDLRAAMHPEVVAPFLAMKAEAARDGIDISVTSGFRDFAAQQRIWNMKWRGERALYDAEGRPRDPLELGPRDLIEAILCWSALPGASRHHWGSELDVVDRAAVPAEYRVQLVPAESAPGGPFHRLHCWLDEHMGRYGFFRPYRTFRGGVRPEPWHLSFAPVAQPALEGLTQVLLRQAIATSEMLGKELVLEMIPELHARYVANVDTPEAAAAA